MERTTTDYGSHLKHLFLAALVCSQAVMLFALYHRSSEIDVKVTSLISRGMLVPVSDHTISFTGPDGLSVTIISASIPPITDVSQAYRWWGGSKGPNNDGSPILAVREIVIRVEGQPVRVPISATSGLTDVKAVIGESDNGGFNLNISGGSEGTAYTAVLRAEKMWFGYAVVWRRIRDNELTDDLQERTEYTYASNKD